MNGSYDTQIPTKMKDLPRRRSLDVLIEDMEEV